MRLRVLLLCAVVLSAKVLLANGDVAGSWSLEQSPVDASAYQHPGFFVGQPLWVSGAFGWGARLNGNSYLRVPNHPALEPQMITVEGWIRHAGFPGHYQYVLAKGARSGCNSATYAFNTETNSGLRVRLSNYRLGVDRASIDIAQDPRFVEGGCTGAGCRALWDGNWHHIAFTADGRHLRFYVDGEPVRNGINGPSAAQLHGFALGYDVPGHNDLAVGAYAGDCLGPFAGDIDEFRVWTRALSDDEIRTRASGGAVAEEICAAVAAPVNDPDLVGAWDFEEAPHADVVDSSPNGLGGIAGVTSGRDDADPYKLCGAQGRAVRFHGSHSVRIPYDPKLEPQSLSLEMWFRHELGYGEQKANGYVIAKGGNLGCQFPSYTFTGVSGAGMQFAIRGTNGGVYASPPAPDAVLYDGQWHHLLGTYDRHVMRLYLDGVEVGNGRPAENIDIDYALSAHRDLTIGMLQNASCTMHVSADIDGVRVWSRAVTPDEMCTPPTLSIGAIPVVTEGAAFTLPVTTDADAIEIAWGDGSVTASASHVYADDGTYAIEVTTPGDCASEATAEVIVRNAPPVIASAFVTGSPQPVGGAITGSVAFTDPGVRDTHTTVWSWGDGTTSTTPTHTYANAGLYAVHVTVTDDDGGAAQAFAGTAAIYDPATRVTGGGWIEPAAGRAQFTVDARADRGRTQIHLGNQRLTFTVHDFVVVTPDRAHLRGRNGEDVFELNVIDGHPDRVRLRVWRGNTLIYDSSAIVELRGNVQMH